MDLETVRLHGRLSATRRRWDAGLALVNRHVATSRRSYVSWSGGKDSTAVALLVDRIDPAVPMVRRSRGVDFPEVVDYCATLAADRGWTYRIAHGDTADTYGPRASMDHAPSTGRHLPEATAALGYTPTGWLYGLRIDEADDRRKLLTRTRGAWVGADGHHVCAPCWNWSTLDVLAWLHHNDVDPCPVYARLAALGVPEAGQRVGYMVGSGGARMGRYVWLRRGWPDQWNRLCDLVPWLKDAS